MRRGPLRRPGGEGNILKSVLVFPEEEASISCFLRTNHPVAVKFELRAQIETSGFSYTPPKA